MYLAIIALSSALGHEQFVGDKILDLGPVEVQDSESIDPEDYSRFEVDEFVLAALHVNNMIEPIQAHQLAWEVAVVESIPSGGPYLHVPNSPSGNTIRVAMTPYGVRKLSVELDDCH